jgi:predicted negative regulator of RcsB-dependent stress response
MKRKNIKWIVGVFVLLGLTILVGYQFTGGREYSTDMNALRTQFNAGSGKVRLLVLLAPT